MFAVIIYVFALDGGLSTSNFSDSLKLYFEQRTANVTRDFLQALQQLSSNQNKSLAIFENRTSAVEETLAIGESDLLHIKPLDSIRYCVVYM